MKAGGTCLFEWWFSQDIDQVWECQTLGLAASRGCLYPTLVLPYLLSIYHFFPPGLYFDPYQILMELFGMI